MFGIAFSRNFQWYEQKFNSIIFTKYIFIALVKKKEGDYGDLAREKFSLDPEKKLQKIFPHKLFVQKYFVHSTSTASYHTNYKKIKILLPHAAF